MRKDDHNTKDNQTTFREYACKNLKRFPAESKLLPYSSITFERNPITSLETLPVLPNLESLNLNSTLIDSFTGCLVQPKLRQLFLKGTPLSHFHNVRLMCISAFGETIEEINGYPLTTYEIEVSKCLSSHLRPYLVSGWILVGLYPVKVMNLQTYQRRIIHVTLPAIKPPKEREMLYSTLEYDKVFAPKPTTAPTVKLPPNLSRKRLEHQHRLSMVSSRINKRYSEMTPEQIHQAAYKALGIKKKKTEPEPTKLEETKNLRSKYGKYVNLSEKSATKSKKTTTKKSTKSTDEHLEINDNNQSNHLELLEQNDEEIPNNDLQLLDDHSSKNSKEDAEEEENLDMPNQVNNSNINKLDENSDFLNESTLEENSGMLNESNLSISSDEDDSLNEDQTKAKRAPTDFAKMNMQKYYDELNAIDSMTKDRPNIIKNPSQFDLMSSASNSSFADFISDAALNRQLDDFSSVVSESDNNEILLSSASNFSTDSFDIKNHDQRPNVSKLPRRSRSKSKF